MGGCCGAAEAYQEKSPWGWVAGLRRRLLRAARRALLHVHLHALEHLVRVRVRDRVRVRVRDRVSVGLRVDLLGVRARLLLAGGVGAVEGVHERLHGQPG